MAEEKIPVAVIAGPTASGKTALAVEIALRHQGEVVSADSMQVYSEWKSNPQKISRTIHLQDRKQAAKHLQSSASRPIDDGNIL